MSSSSIHAIAHVSHWTDEDKTNNGDCNTSGQSGGHIVVYVARRIQKSHIWWLYQGSVTVLVNGIYSDCLKFNEY